ncbi:protein spitz-like isoform X4 [Diorhabda sublineata]|uniref:protein spitz-like isoform X4 n=1 Tax=Diorhabda sublineata TaxID=1163346 RepID=UPI0024E123B9|nr:protein spitz-like isoform X4 [Diorhabda sublineata]
MVLSITYSDFCDACSSRTTPKPRPPAPTPRPNITFPTYACPPEYATWYCLNGATCFTVRIENSLLYNCECPESYMGPRCEYKDLDGSYLPTQQMLETASIAGGATIAVFSVVILCIVVYLHYKRRAKASRTGTDCVDSRTTAVNTPTFGARWRTNPPSPSTDLPIRVQDRGDMKDQDSKIELQQVTTLLPTSNEP